MTPAWLPDWKDEGAYPKESTPKFWAWEFLRRNPEYQSDYQVFSQLPDAEDGHTTGKWKGSPWPGGRCDYFYCNPPALPGELFRDYRARTKNEYEVTPWADYLTRKWGLFPVHDPAEPRESSFFVMGGDPDLEEPPYGFDTESGIERWHSPPLVFDLRHSNEAQCREVEWFLNDLREARKIPVTRSSRIERRDLYRTYLRLLDAELSGASRGEMAEILYPKNPDTDTVSKALSTAKKLRDGGYRDLIAHP